MRNPDGGDGVVVRAAKGKGEYRHGDEGRFGGAQCPRDRLARTVYLVTFDNFELCFGACGDALERATAATLALNWGLIS
jgi:hypothetical protein